MTKSKELLFAEVIVAHKNCPLLLLKRTFKGHIGETTVQGIVHRSPARHIISLIVRTAHLRDICNEIKDIKSLELMDVVIRSEKPEESRIYCYVTDDFLNILSQGDPTTFWIPEYQLHDYYRPFGGPAEYFHSFIPDREFFLDQIGKLRGAVKKTEGEIQIQYRFHHGIEKGRIPDLTIGEQYIIERVLETNFLENHSKKELAGLAEELAENPDSLSELVQDLCTRIYVMGAMVYFSR